MTLLGCICLFLRLVVKKRLLSLVKLFSYHTDINCYFYLFSEIIAQ